MRQRPYREELLAISPGVAQLLEGGGQATGAWQPALDVFETKDAYVVVVDVPGVSGTKIDVTLESGVLTVRGERRFHPEVAEEQFHRVERRFGHFARRVSIPSSRIDPDGVSARMADGVLTVEVQKAEAAQPRRIQVVEQQTIDAE